MSSVVITLLGYSHRILVDGTVQSRPAGSRKESDWQYRSPEDVNLNETQMWMVREHLKQLSSDFPSGMVISPRPKDGEEVQAPMDGSEVR